MYKRRDRNSFSVAAEEILRRRVVAGGGGEGRQGEGRDGKKEYYYGGGKNYAIGLHFPARRQMEDGGNGARAKGCREAGRIFVNP